MNQMYPHARKPFLAAMARRQEERVGAPLQPGRWIAGSWGPQYWAVTRGHVEYSTVIATTRAPQALLESSESAALRDIVCHIMKNLARLPVRRKLWVKKPIPPRRTKRSLAAGTPDASEWAATST